MTLFPDELIKTDLYRRNSFLRLHAQYLSCSSTSSHRDSTQLVTSVVLERSGLQILPTNRVIPVIQVSYCILLYYTIQHYNVTVPEPLALFLLVPMEGSGGPLSPMGLCRILGVSAAVGHKDSKYLQK